MTASRLISSAAHSLDGEKFDLSLAALAGLSAGFVLFAMPADIFAGLVAATGLPSVLSAAQPPLGTTARIAAAVFAAGAAFAGVFLLLRLLDRLGGGSSETFVEEEAPRLRRRDFHPDAPATRPISAARDLGEPESAESEDSASSEYLAELILSEPAPEPETAIPDEAPQPFRGDEEPRPPKSAPAADAGHSIAELMERLERGLARREPASLPETPAPPAVPDAADDRLRSAIESLQRMTARQA